jgi:hypothetical protein
MGLSSVGISDCVFLGGGDPFQPETIFQSIRLEATFNKVPIRFTPK